MAASADVPALTPWSTSTLPASSPPASSPELARVESPLGASPKASASLAPASSTVASAASAELAASAAEAASSPGFALPPASSVAREPSADDESPKDESSRAPSAYGDDGDDGDEAASAEREPSLAEESFEAPSASGVRPAEASVAIFERGNRRNTAASDGQQRARGEKTEGRIGEELHDSARPECRGEMRRSSPGAVLCFPADRPVKRESHVVSFGEELGFARVRPSLDAVTYPIGQRSEMSREKCARPLLLFGRRLFEGGARRTRGVAHGENAHESARHRYHPRLEGRVTFSATEVLT